MENWGAILTFERYLLLDPAITDPETQTYLYTALAHEVAHQWFGNIVTMAWWDDLWLNEGFASWMETKASARFRPEWHPLLSRVDERETAMAMTLFHHPSGDPANPTAAEVNRRSTRSLLQGRGGDCDARSLCREDAWRSGIRNYIQRHRYSNTTSDDLWRAVEETGATGITGIAHDFTRQPGIPLVRASAECRGGNTALSLTQDEFSRDRAAEVASRPQRWRVPLLVSPARPAAATRARSSAALEVPGCAG